MSAPAATRRPAPYGLAFAIDDLVRVREWGRERHLVMRVALDRVMNGAEYEEMILLSPRGVRETRLMLWRSRGSVYLQTATSRPRGFLSVQEALTWLCPPSARRLSRARPPAKR